MINQIGKNNRENSRLNYIGSHIPKRENLSIGRCGQRAYVFASGKDERSKLETVGHSHGFYRRLENIMGLDETRIEGPVRDLRIR